MGEDLQIFHGSDFSSIGPSFPRPEIMLNEDGRNLGIGNPIGAVVGGISNIAAGRAAMDRAEDLQRSARTLATFLLSHTH